MRPIGDILRPSSDLVTSQKPFIADLKLDRALATGMATLGCTLHRAEPGLDGTVIEEAVEVPLHADAGGEPGRVQARIDAAGLAEGEYTGELALNVGEERRSWPIAFFRVPEPVPPEFPFGLYAVPGKTAQQDEVLKKLKAAGINLICEHMYGLEGHRGVLDRCARFGLRFRPSMRFWDAGHKKWPEDSLAVLSDGSQARRLPCLNSPALRKSAATNVAGRLREYAEHPAFSGTVYFGDDLFLDAQFKEGRAFISCYCERCKADYKRATGQEPPITTEQKLGVVAEDDPWLRWMQYRCRQNYAGFIRAIEAVKDEVAPGTKIGLCHGWPDNPFTSVATGLYAPRTQPTDVVSSYCYPFLRSPASDFIGHHEIAKMGNREKEVWMLGLFAADNTVAPTWQVYQNYWNMLAAGYKSMAFFSWWDYAKIMERDDEKQKERAAIALDALTRCGDHKDWILPCALNWDTPEAPNAVLYSFTTEAFDITPVNYGHRHLKEVFRLYRLALAKQLPLKIISEEEVRNGMLDQFEAVCLHDVRALPGDVKVVIQKYADKGKTVLLDNDLLYTDGWHPQVRVQIKGALEASPETMIAMLSDRTQRPLEVSNPDVTIRHFVSGDADYFVFVNNYADRYCGMGYSYGDPEENYRRAALVRDEPVEAEVRLNAKGRYLFDLSTGQPAGRTDAPLKLQLEPSWGRVLVSLPTSTAQLRVDAPRSARQGETVSCELEMLDANGRRLPGAFTVKATVETPSGRRSRYSTFLGIRDGIGRFALPLGVNDETGTWKLTFEGGFPRQSLKLDLEVKDAAARRAVFSANVL